jgi:hypothetical protein
MTDYELIDSAGTFFGLGLTCLMGYFSVLASYLIAAYVVGSSLSRQQAITITGLYLAMQLFMSWGAVVYLWGARALASGVEGATPQPIGPHHVVLPLLLIGILAGLKFMWDVRHLKTE